MTDCSYCLRLEMENKAVLLANKLLIERDAKFVTEIERLTGSLIALRLLLRNGGGSPSEERCGAALAWIAITLGEKESP
jgi:hypothetical protein